MRDLNINIWRKIYYILRLLLNINMGAGGWGVVFQNLYWSTSSLFQIPMFEFFLSDHIQSSIKQEINLSQAFYTNKIILLQLSSYFRHSILRNMQTSSTVRIILSVMDLGYFKTSFKARFALSLNEIK